MIGSNIKLNNFILAIVLFLSILPILCVGSFGIPVLYLLLPIGALILFFILLGKIKIPDILEKLIFIFSLIIIEIIISTIYGTVTAFNRFIFPTDSIQYIARFLFLISFVAVFYNKKLETDIFIKYFLIFLNIGMTIGILQWIPWPGRELFVRLYPFTKPELQLKQLVRPLSGIRVHGLAQHATSNGGLATFFFIFAYSVFRYYKKHRILSVLLMILSIINIVSSQARAGMLMLVFSMFLFYIISIYISKEPIKPTIYIVLIISTISVIGMYLYNNGNPIISKIVFRWENLFETNGGARINQIQYALELRKNIGHYIFGISKQYQNYSDIKFHIEVEPVNILVLYGILGFALQYFLVVFLLIYFLKKIRIAITDRPTLTLLVASFVGLLSYQVFSIGYFFFREIRVGLFPWILMGVTIGAYERYEQEKHKSYSDVKIMPM